MIYFNPADLEYPVAFNPLENVSPDHRYLVASGMISVLKKVWADFWGPRLEHILRNSLLTLLENPGSTLLDLPKLLTDERFREVMLRRVNHPQVRDFWFPSLPSIRPGCARKPSRRSSTRSASS